MQEYVFTKETPDFILDKFMLEISLVKVILISGLVIRHIHCFLSYDYIDQTLCLHRGLASDFCLSIICKCTLEEYLAKFLAEQYHILQHTKNNENNTCLSFSNCLIRAEAM